jgi:hypothetical protein
MRPMRSVVLAYGPKKIADLYERRSDGDGDDHSVLLVHIESPVRFTYPKTE